MRPLSVLSAARASMTQHRPGHERRDSHSGRIVHRSSICTNGEGGKKTEKDPSYAAQISRTSPPPPLSPLAHLVLSSISSCAPSGSPLVVFLSLIPPTTMSAGRVGLHLSESLIDRADVLFAKGKLDVRLSA